MQTFRSMRSKLAARKSAGKDGSGSGDGGPSSSGPSPPGGDASSTPGRSGRGGAGASTSAPSPGRPGNGGRGGGGLAGGAGGAAPPPPPSPLPLPPRPGAPPPPGPAAFAVALPTFRDVTAAEKPALFVAKLRVCCSTFDFSDPASHLREKEAKRQTLLECVDFVNGGPGRFSEEVAPDVVAMVGANLFRALPPGRAAAGGGVGDGVDPEEEEPTLEPAWPHLQIVYEFLLRYIVSPDTDAKAAKKHVDQAFILRLLELFDSEDPRERDYLKTILHRVYGKFMAHRPFIRRAVNHVFYRFIFETERHNGIAELLEILGSIINGFALPLKEEHKLFLGRALMPLHKPKCVGMYHQQLAYCVTQFVEKDAALASPVLASLLRYWPATNSAKEVLFLGELEEVLELTPADAFGEAAPALFSRIAKCLTSPHFQVAERALFLWNNEYVVSLVSSHRRPVLQAVCGALERNAAGHWNAAVHGLSVNVRRLFQEMDPALYDECKAAHEQEEEAKAKHEAARTQQWAAIEAAAQRQARKNPAAAAILAASLAGQSRGG